jgi:hypothetical protein
MKLDQQETLRELAAQSLKDAETAWENVGVKLVCFAANSADVVNASESVRTKIPGYPVIEES